MFDLCDLLNILYFDRPAILCCVHVRMIHYITTATQYSWLGYELVLGTSWSGYELVVGTSWSRYELVLLGTSWLGYELAWYDLVRVRVDWKPSRAHNDSAA